MRLWRCCLAVNGCGRTSARPSCRVGFIDYPMMLDRPHEAPTLSLEGCLHVSDVPSYAGLQTRCHFVLHGYSPLGQHHTADVQAFQAYEEAVVKLRHQQEELGLCSWVCCLDLKHALERRHDGLGARDAACPDHFGPTGVEVAPLPWPLVELDDEKAVGIREVWCDEETARAKLEVVAVPVEAKCGLPPLRARHVGSAE